MRKKDSKADKLTRRVLGGILLALLIAGLAILSGCGGMAQEEDHGQTGPESSISVTRTDHSGSQGEDAIPEGGSYDSREDVCQYLETYGRLPQNYIDKNAARDLGWKGGSLEEYAPGKCIGGDRFGNYEGKLPQGEYRECDIDTLGKKSRGAKRIVFSDSEIYYTEDHYNSFEKIGTIER